jgi:hypothetical protein
VNLSQSGPGQTYERFFSPGSVSASNPQPVEAGRQTKEDHQVTTTLVSKFVGRSIATLALLGIVIVLAVATLVSLGAQNAGSSTPSFGKPIAGKTVSGSPSRRS